MTPIQIVSSIILVAGLLGGFTNFFLNYDLNYKSKECRINLIKSLLTSLCATLTVPLFLQVISNNILDFNGAQTLPAKNYLILTGFCVLAAFFSRRFLDDLYVKISKVELKADEAQKTADRIDDNNNEIDDIDNYIVKKKIIDEVPTTNKNITKDKIKKVINSIISSKFTYRTVKGIAKETEILESDVQDILLLFKKLGFAAVKKNKENIDVWRIKIEALVDK